MTNKSTKIRCRAGAFRTHFTMIDIHYTETESSRDNELMSSALSLITLEINSNVLFLIFLSKNKLLLADLYSIFLINRTQVEYLIYFSWMIWTDNICGIQLYIAFHDNERSHLYRQTKTIQNPNYPMHLFLEYIYIRYFASQIF